MSGDLFHNKPNVSGQTRNILEEHTNNILEPVDSEHSV